MAKMKPLTTNRSLPFVVRLPNLDLKVSEATLSITVGHISQDFVSIAFLGLFSLQFSCFLVVEI